MRGHGAHMWMCGAVIVVALAFVLATGSAVYVLWPLACMVMMGGMMWLMMRGGGRGDGPDRSGER